jgi:integrase
MARSKITKTDAAGRNVPIQRAGWGTVEELPSKRFRARYSGPDGRKHTAPDTFDTEASARAWLAIQRQNIDRGIWRPYEVARVELFKEYAENYIRQRRNKAGQPLRPNTRADYQRHLKHLEPLHKLRLSDITAEVIRAAHARRATDSGDTQAGSEARFLSAVLGQAAEDGIIDPLKFPSNLKNSKTGRDQRQPTPGELGELLGAMKDRLRLMIVLGAATGARLGEVRALERQDLTRVGKGKKAHYTLRITKQAERNPITKAWEVSEPKSETSVRPIALPKWATPYVDTHLADHTGEFPGSLLFPSGGTGPYVDMAYRRAWDAARDAAKVPRAVKFHQLRHYYGTAIATGGASAQQIKAAMGHSSIQTSQTYIHMAHGADEAVAAMVTAPRVKKSNVVQLRKRENAS